MLPQTYVRLTTQDGTGTERDTGRTGHDTTPNHPTTPWSKVWGNLRAVCSSEEVKAAWLMVIHDLIPTNDGLAKIQRSATNNW